VEEDVKALLRCPACGGKLAWEEEACRCANRACGAVFPLVDGVPFLLIEGESLFSADDYRCARKAFFKTGKRRASEAIEKILPTTSVNIKGKENYGRLAGLLTARAEEPLVLVLGAGESGEGMETFLTYAPPIRLVESDVFPAPNVALVCDGLSIPFEDGVFDGVIAQAVLEHVAAPEKCVDEIWRVLKPEGLVYAETAFMQQVHGAPYDFTRFTYLGHRRLFRKFASAGWGVVCGPGMALAWSYEHFLLSFTASRLLRKILKAWARLTAFPLKYFDYYLARKAGSRDAASAYYFIGEKSDRSLSDEEVLREISEETSRRRANDGARKA
jgi:ubiquinone/menaquinone biosynthesis C-methylase UbiE/uncharacterized protein YbaR (Trm112 family)